MDTLDTRSGNSSITSLIANFPKPLSYPSKVSIPLYPSTTAQLRNRYLRGWLDSRQSERLRGCDDFREIGGTESWASPTGLEPVPPDF